MGVLSVFCLQRPVLSSNLSFGIQKPSHVTNIHWKFQDFLPSSLQVIKVFHFTLRSEDSVNKLVGPLVLRAGFDSPKGNTYPVFKSNCYQQKMYCVKTIHIPKFGFFLSESIFTAVFSCKISALFSTGLATTSFLNIPKFS